MNIYSIGAFFLMFGLCCDLCCLCSRTRTFSYVLTGLTNVLVIACDFSRK